MRSELIDGLRSAFRCGRWRVSVHDDELEVVPAGWSVGQAAPASADWERMLVRLTGEFDRRGVRRDALMPLTYARGSEVLHSAVQALDPYLKDGKPHTYRTGFLPQPVVRARFDPIALPSGHLSAFVNASRVHPVRSAAEFAVAVREGVDVLTAVGLDRRSLRLSADLGGWDRAEVSGVTIRLHSNGTEVADFVFLQSKRAPRHRALDMGFSLERLVWAASGRQWDSLVFGWRSDSIPTGELDALRTAVLLVGSGIDPSASGPGKIARRALRLWPTERPMPRDLVATMLDFWAATGLWLRPLDETFVRLSGRVVLGAT